MCVFFKPLQMMRTTSVDRCQLCPLSVCVDGRTCGREQIEKNNLKNDHLFLFRVGRGLEGVFSL